MKIISADISGSLIINNTDVTQILVSSSVWSGSLNQRVSNLESTASVLTAASGTLDTRVGSLETTSSILTAASGTLNTRVGSLETTASILTAASGTLDTRTTRLESTASILTVASGTLDTRVVSLESTASILVAASASLSTTSGSLNTRVVSLESTASVLTAASASLNAGLTNVIATTGSFATTGSNTFTGTQYFSSIANANSFTATASFYSDGGMRVSRDMYVSGTAYFNNVVVYGTQSINFLTASQLNIATNIITVNTATPTVRFGGLAVYDSGSTGLTGSMLWDSEDNQWIYSNPSGSTYDSAMFLVGPRNSGPLGNEVGITCNFLSKGNGMHHMTSSAIFDDGSRTCFYGNSIVTSTGVGCFSGAVCAASVASTGTITGTTIYGSTAICGGTVSGTTGTFSSTISAGQSTFTVSSGTNIELNKTGGPSIQFNKTAAPAQGWQLSGEETAFKLYNTTPTTTTPFQIASTGAATFSSTVTGTTIYGSTAICGATVIGSSIVCSAASVYAATNIRVGSGTSAGNASDPAITTGGCTKTGIFFAGSCVALGSGGNSLLLAQTGYVGIGMTDPKGMLHVCGTNCGADIACGAGSLDSRGIIHAQNNTNLGNRNASVTVENACGIGQFMQWDNNGMRIGHRIIKGSTLGNVYFTVGQDSNTFTLFCGGPACFANTVCAPTFVGGIYYDSANTGYYLDPASTSNLYRMTMAERITVGTFPNSTTNTGEAWFGRASDRNQGTYTIQLGGNSASNRQFEVVDYAWSVVLASVSSAGTLSASGDVIAYASDCRLKQNVVPITGALSKIKCINGVSYTWKDGIDCLGFTPSSKQDVGVLAQEIQQVLPEVVKPAPFDQMNGKSKSGENYLTVKYEKIVPLLIEAIKEQQCQIEYLKSKIG